MTGWILHNHFYYPPKFREQTDLYVSAAEREGVSLEPVSNAEAAEKTADFLRTGSGRPDFILFLDKDVRLAERMEFEGIPVFNSAESIRLCDDKALTYRALLGTGIRMPKTLSVPLSFGPEDWTDNPFIAFSGKEIGYPMVVKQTCGSFGQQVWLVNNPEELRAKLAELSPKPALVQEFVSFSRGTDVRLEVVGCRVVAAMRRRSDSDFRSNLTAGGRAEPYEPDGEEEETALLACRALGLTFGGVDLLFGEDGHPVLCEVNSNAHIRNLSACTGVDAAALILREILSRLAAGTS